MFAEETMRYLSDPTSWFNVGFAIQISLVLMVVIGALIALPDRRTTGLMAQDNLGKFLMVFGLGFILLFVLPAILPGLARVGWLGIFFAVFVAILFLVRRFSR